MAATLARKSSLRELSLLSMWGIAVLGAAVDGIVR
jgi:hypothetical protein